jgi:uncharacterized protein YfcZ (UPF0381/DUF406 family)
LIPEMAENSTRTRTTTKRSTTRTRKAPGAKSTATAKRSTTSAKRSTGAKRAAASRNTTKTQTRARQATRGPRNRVEQVQQVAERAVLVQVGAVLSARDRIVEVADSYSSRSKAERQLKKFERRGSTARTRVQREVRKNRTRVERTLNRNERRIERNVQAARRDLGRDSTGLRRNIGANVDLVSAQVENAVQTGITAGTKLAAVATDKVASAA